MSYSVTKEIRFCYGHRLMNHPGKCRHLHGHSVRAAVTVSAAALDAQGMVCDFADLKRAVAGYVQETLDHNLLLHEADPLVPLLRDAGERFLTLAEHPTAEVLARLIFEHLEAQGYPVTEVALWETDTSCARYRR
ncbi:6-pyruvoyltetrahydropterin/6-carboxytetrahydropterin synthase [Methylomarinovum caldicuralii]|uniref:6-carboxy-5,6,7,8-tetrahydropterin synthase n=1 Tax=Methylomarinovum caldicuralii TaxID=438856 RepID=A0AAU9C7A7_9GAMM|nr:6-carboxytetrahydropterin synthase [Methylomarinovum caldicuralii]BCX81276.1 6-pyruvoyltetrahydropterin/6-carboxytetrahydropterin synthase [Methylomarinovum caldicuralii]